MIGWVGLAIFGVFFVLFEVIGTFTRKWWTISQGFAHLRRRDKWIAFGLFGAVFVVLFFHLILGWGNSIHGS